MGKKFNKRKSKNDDGSKASQGAKMRTPSHNAGLPKEHEKLQRYYDALLEFDEPEREAFWAALRRELPNSFRFCGSKGHALAVRRQLETRYIPEIDAMDPVEGNKFEPPYPISWYPDGLAYAMTTPKNVVRKFAPFAAFQRFLVSENSIGNISRQEIVSMIPPLLMDLKPGMSVLDMCAAPGSKAAQLLEMLHAGEEVRMRKFADEFGRREDSTTEQVAVDEEGVDCNIDNSDDGRATGLLIANDADYKRSHMLVHQLKRLSSPNLLVTNHDATMYPPIRLPARPEDDGKVRYLRFDRILADVPCSGDGTLRKNANLWKDWQPGSALGLHVTQIRILVRALQLLKVGGRVVYSTCSMNPVENESVVVSAIERCGGLANVDVIDCSDRLVGMKRVPGRKQWKIMDKTGKIWNSWDEVKQYTLENDIEVPGRVAYSMFARPEGETGSDIPLERCMRVYSHLQDTGGFFITVLEKKADFKAKPEDEIRRDIPLRSERNQRPSVATAPGGLTVEDGHIKNETLMDDPPPVVGTKRPLEGGDIEDQDVKRARTVPSQDTLKPDVESTGVETKAEVEVPVEKSNGATEAPVEESKPVTEAPVESKPAEEAVPADAQQAEAEAFAPPPPVNGAMKASGKMNNYQAQYEEPYKYLPSDHAVIANIASFYNVSDRFPRGRFMVRNATAEPVKSIYYTSELVRDILIENEGRGMKFVHGGVKMFVRQDAPSAEICRWRIQSEGMSILEGYVGPERVVTLTKQDTLRTLLREMFPRIAGDEWKRLNEIGERVRDVGMGCCVLRVEPSDKEDGFDERMVIPLWKSLASLNLMLPKEDRAAMLLRLWNDTTPLVNNTLKEAREKEAREKEAAKEAEKQAETETESKEEVVGDAALQADAARDEAEQADADADAEAMAVEDAPTP